MGGTLEKGHPHGDTVVSSRLPRNFSTRSVLLQGERLRRNNAEGNQLLIPFLDSGIFTESLTISVEEEASPCQRTNRGTKSKIVLLNTKRYLPTLCHLCLL